MARFSTLLAGTVLVFQRLPYAAAVPVKLSAVAVDSEGETSRTLEAKEVVEQVAANKSPAQASDAWVNQLGHGVTGYVQDFLYPSDDYYGDDYYGDDYYGDDYYGDDYYGDDYYGDDYYGDDTPGVRGWGVVSTAGHCESKTDTRGYQHVESDRILFIGDSDIEYWNTEKFFPGAENCGVGGGTAAELLYSAPITAEKYTPKDFVVMCSGENDFSWGEKNVSAVFDDMREAVQIFLDSEHKPKAILLGCKPEPASRKLYPLYNKYDEMLNNYAANSAGQVKVIDLWAKFHALGNGLDLYADDKLHMSELGYRYVSEWVKEAMADM